MTTKKVHTITDAKTARSNDWKLAKTIIVALAPSVITAAVCIVIVKQLEKE
jgi:hypothetical protein